MIELSKYLSWSGLYGLLLLVIVWNGWLDKGQLAPRSLEIFLLISPLLFCARGLLYENRQRYVLASLLALVYFCLGVWHTVVPDERLYGLGLIGLSLCLFFGSYFYLKQVIKK